MQLPDPPLTDGVVLLRPWREEDVAVIATAVQDPVMFRWTSIEEGDGEDEVRAFFAEADGWARAGTGFALVIEDARDGRLLGEVILRDIEESTGEVAYWVRREARGRGIASRAVSLLSRWALTELGLHRLELATDVDNTASQRVAEKCGFVREGVLRQALVLKARRSDCVLFSLLRSDLA